MDIITNYQSMTTEQHVQLLTMWKDAYYNGETLVPDDEYDYVEKLVREVDPENPILSKTGSEATTSKKVKHSIPMGSLSKVKIEENAIYVLAKDFLSKGDVELSLKMDGISLELVYGSGSFAQAITRGDGFIGDDVTDNVSLSNNICHVVPNNFTGSIRSEAIMLKSDLELINAELIANGERPFSNARNAVAGIIRNTDTRFAKYIMLVSYNLEGEGLSFTTKKEVFSALKTLLGGSNVVPTFSFKNTREDITRLNELLKRYDESRSELPYLIDGVVVELNDLDVYHSMGVVENKPKGAIAVKFSPVKMKTTLRGVIWQVGASGAITPVAEFDPIDLDGSIVARASLHNLQLFTEGNFKIGDTITVQKNNDIIPQVVGNEHNGTIDIAIPQVCPVCGAVLTTVESDISTSLVCPNLLCKAKAVGRVAKWCKKSGISSKGVGEAFFNDFVEKYDSLVHLYTLTVEDIMAISPRYQKASAMNIYKAIQSSTEVELQDFFGGLSIPSVGSRTFKKIIDAGYDKVASIQMLSAGKVERIATIDGVGFVTASTIADYVPRLGAEIEMLLKYVTIKEPKKAFEGEYKGSVVFTGSFTTINPATGKVYKRKDLEQMANSIGYEIFSGVKSGLTYLVSAEDDSTSSKSVKAKKLGVTVLNEEDFFNLF